MNSLAVIAAGTFSLLGSPHNIRRSRYPVPWMFLNVVVQAPAADESRNIGAPRYVPPRLGHSKNYSRPSDCPSRLQRPLLPVA
jgi:hypothetical protein